jgi:methionyl-tRNA formyltransferase
MSRDLRIIYMGTPEFAVPSLEILVENNYNVVAVITAPDKPAGRGLKLTPSPVKEAALKHNLKILQPTNLKSPEFLEELKSLKPNLGIIVAFRMLPESIWSLPEYGTFNLHASLLPAYRGAAPINWAIMNGEKETGVTTFFLKHEIDTGNIIFQEKEMILEEDTVGTLYERLMDKGSRLVLKTVEAIKNESYKLTPQPEPQPGKSAPKIFKETCQIDFNRDVNSVYNFIRGLSPYPAAYTTLNDKQLKVYKALKMSKNSTTPGKISINNDSIIIECVNGALDIKELQLEGKKRMTTQDFLKGYRA